MRAPFLWDRRGFKGLVGFASAHHCEVPRKLISFLRGAALAKLVKCRHGLSPLLFAVSAAHAPDVSIHDALALSLELFDR